MGTRGSGLKPHSQHAQIEEWSETPRHCLEDISCPLTVNMTGIPSLWLTYRIGSVDWTWAKAEKEWPAQGQDGIDLLSIFYPITPSRNPKKRGTRSINLDISKIKNIPEVQFRCRDCSLSAVMPRGCTRVIIVELSCLAAWSRFILSLYLPYRYSETYSTDKGLLGRCSHGAIY